MSDSRARELGLGSLVRGEKLDGWRSTVGAFAIGSSGEYYALIACGEFLRAPNQDVFEVSSGLRIGTLLPQRALHDRGTPFWHSIAIITLSSNIRTRANDVGSRAHQLPVSDVGHLLGSQVKAAAGVCRKGVITTTHSVVRLTLPGSADTVIFSGALEAKLSASPPIDRGAAGELIVTEADRVVGLLIAGSVDQCFIAPLAPLLQATGLTLQLNALRPGYEIKALLEAGDAELNAEPDLYEFSARIAG